MIYCVKSLRQVKKNTECGYFMGKGKLFGWSKIVFNRAGARGTFVFIFQRNLLFCLLCVEKNFVFNLDKGGFSLLV